MMIYSISSKTYSCPYEYKHCKYKYRFSGYFLKEDDNAFLACLQKRVRNKHITCSFALYSRTQKCIILRIFVWSWVTLNISMNLRRRKMMFIDLDSTKNVLSHEFLKMTSPQPHHGK